jgi:hypothetical protein
MNDLHIRGELMVRNLALATLTAMGVFSSGWALAATESENFDVSPADWVEFMSRDGALGTNFGYSATNNAGGAALPAGEAGGTFPRTQTVAYYADTTLGGTLSSSSVLQATGKLVLDNDDADGRIDIGWFDSNDPPSKMDLIGFSINNGTQLQAVARPTGGMGYANSSSAAMPSAQYDFTLTYDGAGNLQVTLADPNNVNPDLVASLAIPAGTYELNAFGMTSSGEVGSNVPDLTADLFIDDLNYTTADGVIPEPASMLLLGMGALAIAIRMRRRAS